MRKLHPDELKRIGASRTSEAIADVTVLRTCGRKTLLTGTVDTLVLPKRFTSIRITHQHERRPEMRVIVRMD
jgi:hypothetical protein